METVAPIQVQQSRTPALHQDTNANLKRISQDLEATFISEMLKHAGLGAAPENFNGGHGEEQFGSILRDLQAREFTESGGIGLAEAIYKSLLDRRNG